MDLPRLSVALEFLFASISEALARDSPEEVLQLGVKVPDEGAASYDFRVAVVEGQTSIAHVFTIDAFRPRGDTDDLSLLHISACAKRIMKESLSAFYSFQQNKEKK